MQLDSAKIKYIQFLMKQNIDQLYSSLADHDPDYSRKLFSRREKIGFGIEILNRYQETLHKNICLEWKYCYKIRNSNFNDSVLLIATIADVVSGSIGILPPFTIATILFKIGLNKFCACKGE
jgi:hypothetical protein